MRYVMLISLSYVSCFELQEFIGFPNFSLISHNFPFRPPAYGHPRLIPQSWAFVLPNRCISTCVGSSRMNLAGGQLAGELPFKFRVGLFGHLARSHPGERGGGGSIKVCIPTEILKSLWTRLLFVSLTVCFSNAAENYVHHWTCVIEDLLEEGAYCCAHLTEWPIMIKMLSLSPSIHLTFTGGQLMTLG